jgi:hypothetical protein
VHCRNDQRRVLGMIHILSQLYTIPAGADVRPVYCRIDS